MGGNVYLSPLNGKGVSVHESDPAQFFEGVRVHVQTHTVCSITAV